MTFLLGNSLWEEDRQPAMPRRIVSNLLSEPTDAVTVDILSWATRQCLKIGRRKVIFACSGIKVFEIMFILSLALTLSWSPKVQFEEYLIVLRDSLHVHLINNNNLLMRSVKRVALLNANLSIRLPSWESVSRYLEYMICSFSDEPVEGGADARASITHRTHVIPVRLMLLRSEWKMTSSSRCFSKNRFPRSVLRYF